ncbi:MAG: hypothetical protein ACRC1J_03690, partial [Sandaracinobacteroides sp.]
QAARELAFAQSQPQVPAEMLVPAAFETASLGAPAGNVPLPSDPLKAPATGSSVPAPGWHRDQILAMASTASRPGKDGYNRASLRTAMLAAGLVPPRPSQRAMLAAAARAALEPDVPRRTFNQPFESDNGRLNGLAERLHADEAEAGIMDVAQQVARLEGLIARIAGA